MIDWRIAKIASSGMRGMRLRLRQPMTRPSLSAWRRRQPPAWAGAGGRVVLMRLPSHSRLPRIVVLVRAAWPVSAEEDVVEGRPAQADVVDGDAGLVEVAHDLDERASPAARSARSAAAGVLVDRALALAVARQDLDRVGMAARSWTRPRSARRRPGP